MGIESVPPDAYVPIGKALTLVDIDRQRLRAAIKNGTVAILPNEHDKRSKLVKLSDVEQLQLKRCKRCKKRKSLLLFHRDGDGYTAICKTCKNRQNQRSARIRRYGLADAEFAQLRQEANGKCMLCGKKPAGNKNNLEIDHNHTTGAVRGLLCHRCNMFVYAVNESPEHARLLADKLAGYLERTGQ